MCALRIITTGDGSHSILHETLDETYHSVHGAVQESTHVFIRNGFEYRVGNNQPGGLKVLEVGFGTGLNALLTLINAQAHALPVHYTAIEAYPLEREVWGALNYASDDFSASQFQLLHHANWGTPQAINQYFEVLKLQTRLEEATFAQRHYDIVYYDAFAPVKQPEMWRRDRLESVALAMNDEAVFVTYCASGQLKRDLRDLGLKVESLAGPPGKREMVRAVK